jgi:hypothetical protein
VEHARLPSTPRPLRESGKILVLGNLLLVSEPNVGVHIFDNSNPSEPKVKYFRNITGNVLTSRFPRTLYRARRELPRRDSDGENPDHNRN